MRALVVHPGTQHSHRLAYELYCLNALTGFHTGFAVVSGGTFDRVCRFAPPGLRRRVANRRLEGIPIELVHLQPLLEWTALARIGNGENDQRVLYWRNERFQKSIPSHAMDDADVVIGFDTSSWVLAERCRKIGKPLIVVQTTSHPDSKKAILDEITLRYPQWLVDDKPRLPMVRQAEQEEHDNATLIIASSSFNRQTLVDNGVSQAKIRTISHGVDCDRFSPIRNEGGHPFRFVFVGNIDACKGVPLLLEAWRQLRAQKAELWLVGPSSTQIKSSLPALPGMRYFGAVPHKELPDILRQCDVFVFPSFFEGFGLVILEAMACGLPVITTTSTAGPDLLQEGNAGWLVPPGDTAKLTSAMDHCLSNPTEIQEAGRSARAIAERFSWKLYGDSWLAPLEEVKLAMPRSRHTTG